MGIRRLPIGVVMPSSAIVVATCANLCPPEVYRVERNMHQMASLQADPSGGTSDAGGAGGGSEEAHEVLDAKGDSVVRNVTTDAKQAAFEPIQVESSDTTQSRKPILTKLLLVCC